MLTVMGQCQEAKMVAITYFAGGFTGRYIGKRYVDRRGPRRWITCLIPICNFGFHLYTSASKAASMLGYMLNPDDLVTMTCPH